MRTYKAQGIVIKRVNINEADRILTVFTREYGKITLLAKGVRRITSRRSPNIELFNEIRFSVFKGKSLDILTEVQVLETYPVLRENLDTVGLGYYVSELVEGMCAEQQPYSDIYDVFSQILHELNDRAVAQFEKILITSLGFWPAHQELPSSSTEFIESLLDRKLKSKYILSKLS